MGIFEGITHSEEIQNLNNDAQNKYNEAKKKFDDQKKSTSKSLESLGQLRVRTWSNEMNKFVDRFSKFSNIDMVCVIEKKYNFIGENETLPELINNMTNATTNAAEIAKVGALSVGTGALVGIAVYGGAAMFADTSTGKPISELSGNAKKNATLAWLGGGTKEDGGLGEDGGTVILAGIVIASIMVISGVINSSKGKENLAEAKKNHAEVEEAVANMNIVITEMEAIQKCSDNYRMFIEKFSKLFEPYLKKMSEIAKKYEKGDDDKIDYNDLSEMEQKTLHLSWLLAQLYYHVLSIPILTEKGEVNPDSRLLLQKAKQDYAELSGQVTKLEDEKKQIKKFLMESQGILKKSKKIYYQEKQNISNALIKNGKERIDLWESSFSPFMACVSEFENIKVENVYKYNITNYPIEFIFESVDSVISCIREQKSRGIDLMEESGLTEVALFGGEDYLSELSKSSNDRLSDEKIYRHEMSLWFAGKLEAATNERISFSGVSDCYISEVKQIVDGISGRENLKQACEIKKYVDELSEKINNAVENFRNILQVEIDLKNSIEKYNQIQNNFLKKINEIKSIHHCNGNKTFTYAELSEAEKHVCEMSFIIAKVQYALLASYILSENNGGDSDETSTVIEQAETIYKQIKKDTFKTSEHDREVADIIWKKDANKAMNYGFITSFICTAFMIMQFMSGNYMWIISIVGAAVSFPIFFYLKNISQVKLFIYRYIRIALAIIIIVGVKFIG